MSTELPHISVIVPCYNEVKFIEQVVRNIATQDYPAQKMEVIFSDGMSEDGTREKLRALALEYSFIRTIDNPERFVPTALNRAIKVATGEVIVRLDAHAIYPLNYLTRLVSRLITGDAENVGGVWETKAGADTNEARAIVLATSHPLGIGNASYRLGGNEESYVDTVPYGCFKRSLFDRIGFFDEDLLRNQDDEFNGRIIKHGGKILMLPDVKIGYFARESRAKLRRMFYQYGLFKPLVNIKLGAPATLRQFVPPLFVGWLCVMSVCALFYFPGLIVLMATVLLYVLSIVTVSIRIAQPRSLSLVRETMFTFPSIHFSYGIGYIFGLYRYVLMKAHLKNKTAQVNTSR
jgi:glycosyltransferase involved in cell wall biosynthesis